jgi:hypothetical protein
MGMGMVREMMDDAEGAEQGAVLDELSKREISMLYQE